MTHKEENDLQDVLDVHDLFWQSLVNRNADIRFGLCSEDVTFIGTGHEEYASNKEEYKAINLKSLKQYNGQLELNVVWLKPKLENGLAWVESAIEWRQIINEKDYLEVIRNTVILKKIDQVWKVAHVHGSVPDYRLHSGDYMTNETTVARNQELEKLVIERTEELEQTIASLKNAHETIIQAEKMASLGELTAGIAHEIQNPLNFVNNFSEVTLELVDEMMTEIKQSNMDEVVELGTAIKDNIAKIYNHGHRAESIVKNMLQHSRKSTGNKELTDINNLCDEYLRLSYHGLKAKYKNFKANFKTNLDPSLDKIMVEPQDISRVILNMINNAFYAVNEKDSEADTTFSPLVSIFTQKMDQYIIITIKDNGNGIPLDIKQKIFQPFFTTKPAGRGTGLGLSMSYEIITKGHNGKIDVYSEVGIGSTFTITLPIN